jgi:zinc/manganese transport system ATP-binding protein
MHPVSSAPQLLALCNLTVGYERHPAIHHVNLTLMSGEMVAIVGPNGAGKSTLIKALAGVLRPMQGHIQGGAQPPSVAGSGWQRWLHRLRPAAATDPNLRVAYLPQQAEMDRQFPIAVIDMVSMGLWHEVGALRPLSAAQRQRSEVALAQVGLTGFAHRTLGTLSGGQFQRALFARLLLQDAPLILLDEPFVGMDTRTTRDLLALMHTWHAQGRTVVAVLHDLEQVAHHFPTTWLLARELVAAGPTAQVLTPEHLARARTLNEAFDDTATDCDVPESVPSDAVPVGGAAIPVPHQAHQARAHTHAHAHGEAHAHGHAHTHG